MELHEYLTQKATEAGLTHQAIAERLGPTRKTAHPRRPTVTNWLNGTEPVPIERLVELTPLLNLDPKAVAQLLADKTSEEFARYVTHFLSHEEAIALVLAHTERAARARAGL